MPNDEPASKRSIDLRKRAEKALQERPPDYLESTELSNEEVHNLIHELQVHQIELEMQNDELRRFQNEIEESRNKYSHLYDFAPVGYFTVKEKGIIAQANLTGAALLGIDRASLIGKPLTRFVSMEDQDTFYLHRLQVLKKNGNHTCEIKMMNYNKTPFYARLESIAVQGEDENAAKLRTAITDITDRKMIDQQLQASLKEKEVLLQEVHHRVKNNMQVMISMINLQCEKIEDKKICDELNKIVDRINSMVLVHNQLYKSKDFLKVDINKYIHRIAQNLFVSHGVDTAKISLKIGKSDIALSLDSAISCGLIITELITNSLKYAFPKNRKGEIRVEFGYLGDGQLEMRMSDDGVGIPANFDFRDSDTLGVKIANALAEHQLGGTVRLDSTNGTQFLIRFKERPPPGVI
ncbi:MAG: histidine kinase dimerization/phosphoacceptor domain -containing protein [Desulfobacterales bacterium]